MRSSAWQWIIGNELHITEELFVIMSGRAQEVKEFRRRRSRDIADTTAANISQTQDDNRDNGDTNGAELFDRVSAMAIGVGNKEDSIELITIDVKRTFPELMFFHRDGPLAEPLYTILETYACYRPDVGYVQGMSYLAAMLLLNMHDTFTAFVGLCNLLNQDMYFKFFTMNAEQMSIHMDVFDTVFKHQLPQLHAHFAALDIRAEMYLYEWLLTIYSRSLPLDTTHRIWDNFLVNGHSFLFRTALGLLKLLAAPPKAITSGTGNAPPPPSLMDCGFEGALSLLHHVPGDIDSDALFGCIDKITISQDRMNKLIQQRENQRSQ